MLAWSPQRGQEGSQPGPQQFKIYPYGETSLDSRPTIVVVSVPNYQRFALCRYAELANFQVVAVDDLGGLDWSMILDVVVCEHRAPQTNAVKICRHIRLHSDVPILVVTSTNEIVAQRNCLEAGADMCLASPYDGDHFVSCLRALLRRSRRRYYATGVEEVGEFRILTEAQRCVAHGKEVRLTSQEFRLMSYLVSHPYRLLSHQEILRAVWGEHYVNKPEFLRPVVMSLRKKVEKNWQAPAHIRTERKGGYFFVPTCLDPDTVSVIVGNNKGTGTPTSS